MPTEKFASRLASDPAADAFIAEAEPAHHAQGVAPADAGGADATIVRLLGELFHAVRTNAGGLSVDCMTSRTGERMSTVRRYLSALEDAGLVQIRAEVSGGGSVMLTAAGIEACERFMGGSESEAT